MNKNHLYIPSKLKIGFQKRSDTYDGNLAYVIYYDGTGVLRKEGSWASWRDKKIDPIDINNDPTEGFVLNRNVGGYKSNWNFRSSKIRVYDPRGFEVEISLENLLLILQYSTCDKGKGLQGKFVYSWEKKDLFLLPVDCELYNGALNSTNIKEKTLKASDLKEGYTYITKSNELYMYVGKLFYLPKNKKVHLFVKESAFNEESININNFECFNSLSRFSCIDSEEVHPKYAKFRTWYTNSNLISKVVNTTFENTGKILVKLSYNTNEIGDIVFYINGIQHRVNTSPTIMMVATNGIQKERVIKYTSVDTPSYYPYHYNSYEWNSIPIREFVKIATTQKYSILENGNRLPIDYESIIYPDSEVGRYHYKYKMCEVQEVLDYFERIK